MVLHAARDLQLSDAEKAKLDAIDGTLQPNDAPRSELRDLQADVVAGIRAGKLDMTKVQPDYVAIDKALQARQAKEADALNALHAALDPTKRAALVAALQAKQAAREAQRAAHDDADAGSPADWTKRRVDRLTRQLALDDGQQKSVAAIVAKGDPMTPATMRAKRDAAKKHMDALLTAFAADPFDATKLDLSPMPGKTPHEAIEKDTTFVSQLLPILTQDQRIKLAAQRERMGGRRHSEGDEGPWDQDRDDNGGGGRGGGGGGGANPE
jgi:hypothetical protein